MINQLPIGVKIKELQQRTKEITKTIENYVENYVTALEVKIKYNINYFWFDIEIPSTNTYITVYSSSSFTDFNARQPCTSTDLTIDEYTKLLKDKSNINKAIVQAILAFRYITGEKYV